MISAKYFPLALLLTPLLAVNSPLSAQAEPPQPGAGATEASLLLEDDNTPSDATAKASGEDTVAQVRRQRSVRRDPFTPNYFGIGLNVGFDGNTAIGETEFAITSKIKVTPNISFRPGAIIGENAAILVPVTYDFSAKNFTVANRDLPPLIPYVGGGVFFTTDDESEDDLGGLVTAGLDIPISTQFTANAGLNVGFVDDETEWGLLLGVGYNIPRN